MPRGNSFLSDLSEGIFGRLGELRQEQQTRDDQQKQQTLSFLSSLADKVEPESLPILMQQIGDTMGVKGKLKGFWNAFSGLPDRSVEDQLGTKLREVSGLLVGSDTASKSRQANLENLLEPYRQQGTRPRMTSNLPGPPDLQGKIIFRDPRAEQLKLTEERYGLQAQAAAERQYLMNEFRARQQEDRQKHDKDILDLKAENKAKEDVMAEAWDMTIKRGLTAPNPLILSEAAKKVGQRQQWSDDKLKALTQYYQAKSQEAISNAASLKAGGGLTPSQSATIEDRRRENALDLKTRYDKAMANRAQAQKRMSDIVEAINKNLGESVVPGQIEKPSFDPNTGTINFPKGSNSLLMGSLMRTQGLDKILEEYNKAAAELKGFETEAQGAYGNLKTSPYNRYYKTGETFDAPISEVEAEQRSAGGMPSPTSPLRIPKNKGGVQYNQGQRVRVGPKIYIITGGDNDNWFAAPLTNKARDK